MVIMRFDFHPLFFSYTMKVGNKGTARQMLKGKRYRILTCNTRNIASSLQPNFVPCPRANIIFQENRNKFRDKKFLVISSQIQQNFIKSIETFWSEAR